MPDSSYNYLAAGIIKCAILDGDYKFFFSTFKGMDYSMPLNDYLDILLNFANKNKSECRRKCLEKYIENNDKLLSKNELWSNPAFNDYVNSLNIKDEYTDYIAQKDFQNYKKIKAFNEVKQKVKEMELSIKENFEKMYSLKRKYPEEFKTKLENLKLNELEELALLTGSDQFKAQYEDYVVYELFN